jgi:hypothetical protein
MVNSVPFFRMFYPVSGVWLSKIRCFDTIAPAMERVVKVSLRISNWDTHWRGGVGRGRLVESAFRNVWRSSLVAISSFSRSVYREVEVRREASVYADPLETFRVPGLSSRDRATYMFSISEYAPAAGAS